MANIFSRLFSGASGASTLWGFLPASWQMAVITMLSAVTGYVGFQSAGLYWALLGAAAMFSFGMSGTYYFILLRSRASVFELLIIDQISIAQAWLVRKDESAPFELNALTIRGLTFQVHLTNRSERTVYAQLKRVNNSMGGKTVKKIEAPAKDIVIIPATAGQTFIISTLPDIEVCDGLSGWIELELLYGPSKDDLSYEFHIDAEPGMSLGINKENSTGELKMLYQIRKLVHQRA